MAIKLVVNTYDVQLQVFRNRIADFTFRVIKDCTISPATSIRIDCYRGTRLEREATIENRYHSGLATYNDTINGNDTTLRNAKSVKEGIINHYHLQEGSIINARLILMNDGLHIYMLKIPDE